MLFSGPHPTTVEAVSEPGSSQHYDTSLKRAKCQASGKADGQLQARTHRIMSLTVVTGMHLEGLTLAPPGGGGKPLTSRLHLSVAPGQSLLIVGPSGCGKSSLLRAIAGAWGIYVNTTGGMVFDSQRDSQRLNILNRSSWGSLPFAAASSVPSLVHRKKCQATLHVRRHKCACKRSENLLYRRPTQLTCAVLSQDAAVKDVFVVVATARALLHRGLVRRAVR